MDLLLAVLDELPCDFAVDRSLQPVLSLYPFREELSAKT